MSKLLDKAKKVKQKKATWFVISELAPTWVGEGEESLVRPYITLVADLNKDLIRHVNISEEMPGEDDLINSVLQAITKPGMGIGMGFGLGLGGKYRPTVLQTNDTAVLGALEPLNGIDIECQQLAKPALIVNMLRELEKHLTGRDYRPGLQSIPKVTHPLLEELYTAADEYFLSAPYEIISDSEPIAIHFPPDAPPKYGVVMGFGDEEYGLAIYNTAEELALVYSGMQPQEMTDESIYWVAALYDWPHYLPFEDLDAIEEHGWPIADEDAYPFFTRLRPAKGDFELPTESDIRLLAAALRTIPQFVEDNVDEEEFPITGIENVVYELSPMFGHEAIALNWAEIEGLERMPRLDFDEIDEESQAELMEMSMAAVAEFIAEWDVDEGDEVRYDEAMGLGAFLVAYMQMAQMQAHLQEVDWSEDDFDNLAAACWEIGAIILDYAERPIDIAIFTGPPRFVEVYANEMADDEDDVVYYRDVWSQLGNFVQLMDMVMDDDLDGD